MKILLYSRFNRFWHWSQALLIILLLLTGLDVHGSIDWWDFGESVRLHNLFAWALIILTVFAIFWHFTTGAWKHYVPTRQFLKAMIRFYLVDIFYGRPHPVKKSELSKLNPLQRLTYLGLKLVAIPAQIISGILYYFYNDWSAWGLDWMTLKAISVIHSVSAFVLAAFLILHVYLTTTGHTATSNLKAMILGYEEIDEEEA